MDCQEILDKIIKILNELCLISSYNKIEKSTKLNELNLDNFDYVEIEIKLEKEFNLPEYSCDNFVLKSNNFSDLIDKISELINK